MWLDACFKTVSEDYLQNSEQEEKENSVLMLNNRNDEFASLGHSDDMIIYQSPQELNGGFEITPPDSGEKNYFDSTLVVSDSSSIPFDSTITKADTLTALDTVKVDWREIDSTARLEQFKYTR